MLSDSHPIGVLLVNVGTPNSTNVSDVRKYLREFLSDKRVIDIHPILRWMLLNFFILPFRPKTSAEAYRAVWTEQGSPLLVFTQSFAARLAEALGKRYKVIAAMRYGNPTLAEAIATFRSEGIERIVLFPLYPQYASSSTGTAIERFNELIAQSDNVPAVSVVPPFYDDPGFIGACVSISKDLLASDPPDHVLFSFHGLPERQIHKSDISGTHCLSSSECCDVIQSCNRYCYRAQCVKTANEVAKGLGLTPDRFTITFQSRLGRTKWIEPYTDVVLPTLPDKGIKKLAIFCPAFVSDCLETLEEIGIRAKEQFLEAGGESLTLVPCLNDSNDWIEAAKAMVVKAAGD